jgi:molybdopterin molybdotransferase
MQENRTLHYDEAVAICSQLAQRQAAAILGSSNKVETVLLADAAGRVLADAIVADRDQPPFPRSTRDGFAARASDWSLEALPVDGLLRAGELWLQDGPQPGHSVEIMTGAPVPAAVDSVAMVEHVLREQDTVRLPAGRTIHAGENIVAQGAEAKAGDVLVPLGVRIHVHTVAVAASCGYANVSVYRKPRVAVLSTGDELVEVNQKPALQQIRNSNTHTLAALIRALGAEPVLYPPVPDDQELLTKAIAQASAVCDLLLLSGGVSMGKYDLVEPALASLGAQFLFTGIRIQPGKPVVCGELPKPQNIEPLLPFFGLPGNPVSTIVCFNLFVAPVLAALSADRGYTVPFVNAKLAAVTTGKSGLTQFVPAHISQSIQGTTVEAVAWQGSGDLASTARANCFLVIPADAASLDAGAFVTVLLA